MKLNVFACVRQPSQGPTFGIKGELCHRAQQHIEQPCTVFKLLFNNCVVLVFCLQVVLLEVDTLRSFQWKRYFASHTRPELDMLYYIQLLIFFLR